MDETKLAEQIRLYNQLKQENKKVDVASLALNALASQAENSLTPKEKRIAYFVSLAFPPFGLLYAVKFYTSGKDDGKMAAYLCAGLTVAAIVVLLLFTGGLFSSSGLTAQQLQQAPSQYQQLLQ